MDTGDNNSPTIDMVPAVATQKFIPLPVYTNGNANRSANFVVVLQGKDVADGKEADLLRCTTYRKAYLDYLREKMRKYAPLAAYIAENLDLPDRNLQAYATFSIQQTEPKDLGKDMKPKHPDMVFCLHLEAKIFSHETMSISPSGMICENAHKLTADRIKGMLELMFNVFALFRTWASKKIGLANDIILRIQGYVGLNTTENIQEMSNLFYRVMVNPVSDQAMADTYWPRSYGKSYALYEQDANGVMKAEYCSRTDPSTNWLDNAWVMARLKKYTVK